MASQLLPLGEPYEQPSSIRVDFSGLTVLPELIDKCVGSKIWVGK